VYAKTKRSIRASWVAVLALIGARGSGEQLIELERELQGVRRMKK